MYIVPMLFVLIGGMVSVNDYDDSERDEIYANSTPITATEKIIIPLPFKPENIFEDIFEDIFPASKNRQETHYDIQELSFSQFSSYQAHLPENYFFDMNESVRRYEEEFHLQMRYKNGRIKMGVHLNEWLDIPNKTDEFNIALSVGVPLKPDTAATTQIEFTLNF